MLKHLRPIALLAPLIGFASPALSDTAADLGHCAAITDDGKRLACYDVLASKTKSTSTGKAATGWRVGSVVSPVTDSTDVYLQRRSEGTVQTDVFGEAHPIFLIQCVNKKTAVAVNWEFIVGGGTIPVTYRIDDQDPKVADIRISDDFRSIVSWDSDRVVAFLKSLLPAKKLAVQITPLSQAPVAIVFDTTGLAAAIAPLRKACGW